VCLTSECSVHKNPPPEMKEDMANDASEHVAQRIGCSISQLDGDVLPHRQLRFSFPKNQNIRPESAHRLKSQEAPDEGIDLSRDR